MCRIDEGGWLAGWAAGKPGQLERIELDGGLVVARRGTVQVEPVGPVLAAPPFARHQQHALDLADYGRYVLLPGSNETWAHFHQGPFAVAVTFVWDPPTSSPTERAHGVFGCTSSAGQAGLGVWIEDRAQHGPARLRATLSGGLLEQTIVESGPNAVGRRRPYVLVLAFDGETLSLHLNGGLVSSKTVEHGIDMDPVVDYLVGAVPGGHSGDVLVGAVDVWCAPHPGLARELTELSAIPLEPHHVPLGGPGRPDVIVDEPAHYPPQGAPLIVWLHGLTGQGATSRDAHAQLVFEATDRGCLVAWPTALVSHNISRAWNGTSACCATTAPHDDVGYVAQLIDDLSAVYHVDPLCVYVVGSSNGAFLAHRIAIELGDKLAAVACLKGHTHVEPELHTPVAPIPLLHAHGTGDTVVAYNGAAASFLDPQLPGYPSVQEGLDRWIATNGCATTPTLDDTIEAGAYLAADPDTTFDIERWRYDGPAPVERWDVVGAPHEILWSPDTLRELVLWLLGQGGV